MQKGDPRYELVLCLKCNMPICETCYRCHYCLNAMCPIHWNMLQKKIVYHTNRGSRVVNNWREMTQEEMNAPLPGNVELGE